MRKYAAVVLFALHAVASVPASAGYEDSILGATVDGRKVVLFADGTWEYKRRESEKVKEGVELDDYEHTVLPADLEAGEFVKRVRFVLRVKNTGQRPVSSWKGTLLIRNNFNELIVREPVAMKDVVIPPGGVTSTEFTWADNPRLELDPFDQLSTHGKSELRVSLSNLRYVH